MITMRKFWYILFLLLTGCTAISQHQATAVRHTKPSGVITHTISLHMTTAAEVHAICAPHIACERDGAIYMQQRGNWQSADFTLTWDFSGDWPVMEGDTIFSPAWPDESLLGELLAGNLGWPERDYEYHRLLAHEVMHVWGMRHD